MQYCLGVLFLCEVDFIFMKKSISRSFFLLGFFLNIMENIGCFESCFLEYCFLLEFLGSLLFVCVFILYNVVNEQIFLKMFDFLKDILRDVEFLNSI